MMAVELRSIFVVVLSKVTASLSPSTFAIMPNCFSISISPVVALNAACAIVVMSLPKAAATLPKSVRTPVVGVIPAFTKVVNA